MSDKLKPCPFCGGKAKVEFISSINYISVINKKHYNIEFVCQNWCTIKPIGTTATNREEAIENVVKIWNRRVNENDI